MKSLANKILNNDGQFKPWPPNVAPNKINGKEIIPGVDLSPSASAPKRTSYKVGG